MKGILLLVVFLTCKAQFIFDANCYGPSSIQSSDCSLTCVTQTIDLSPIALDGSQSRVFNYWTSRYAYYFILPVCGTAPSFPSVGSYTPQPSWSTSDIWQLTLHSSEAYYLGTYSASSWNAGTYNGAFALSVSYISGQGCTPYTPYRQSTLYVICNNQYTVQNPLITIVESTTCNYKITLEYNEFCGNSVISYPTAAPSSKAEEAAISRAAEAEVIVSVLVVMFAIVGCYVGCRRLCYGSNGKRAYIHPIDGTYAGDTNNEDDVVEMRPRLTTHSSRERQRRLNLLYDQIQIAAEGGYSSTIVPTAVAVSVNAGGTTATALAASSSSSVPVATVVTVNGVRV